MMGRKQHCKNGMEVDCVGNPQHRWRKYQAKSAGKWAFVKNQLNRRDRREAKRDLEKGD